MKKTGVLIFAIIACVLFFAACSTPMEKYEAYISELRDNVFTAESVNYSVQIITGKREEPFVMDGHAGAVREFTVITLNPKAGEGKYSYRVTINGSEFAGKFLPHPFAKTYSADIEARSFDSEILLSITVNGNSETLTAKSVKTDNMIPAAKAVEIAEKRLKHRIDDFWANGTLNAEIYVRLISNPIDNSGGYYWYVAFIGAGQTIYAVLIEPVSMQVAAIRD